MAKPRVCDVPPELKRQLVPIDKVAPAKTNPRRGDVEFIQGSLRAHGQYVPILVRRDTGEVLKGNHTWHAAKAEGWTHIAVLYRDVPSDAAAMEILLIDNVASDRSSWHEPDLTEALAIVENYERAGFTPGQVDRLIAANEKATQPEEPIAALPSRPRTRKGDRILLGRHVLVCGDATDRSTVGLAIDPDDTVACIWTDPPYGIDVVAGAKAAAPGVKANMRRHATMAGDVDPRQLEQLLTETLAAIAGQRIRPGCPLYLCHADTYHDAVIAAMEAAGYPRRQTIVWVKDHLIIGRQDYQWRHELIAYGWAEGAHPWYGDRDKDTVIEHPTRSALEALTHEDVVDIAMRLLEREPDTLVRFSRPRVAEHHPTSKPPGLVAYMLRNSTEPGDVVYDPFGGSGSTLIAAEQTDRHARIVELAPAYCDVIISRWETLTGEKAQRPRRARGKGKPKR